MAAARGKGFIQRRASDYEEACFQLAGARVDWLWIPITIGAALFQNVRTALQKHLTGRLSTYGATFTRFVYGLPLAFGYVLLLNQGFGLHIPQTDLVFLCWVVLGGVCQILATGALLACFKQRNFAVGTALSKSEVVQAAIFALVFLGERVTALGIAAIALGTVGVMLIAVEKGQLGVKGLIAGLKGRAALLGLASGALFAISSVAFRGAALQTGHESFLMAAGWTLLASILLQTLLLGVWLHRREPGELGRVFANWRIAGLVGVTGVLGSACWFTAMTIQQVAYVRTLGMIELVFTFLVSTLVFHERHSARETLGILLLIGGILLVLNR